jgi:hypothetical protein
MPARRLKFIILGLLAWLALFGTCSAHEVAKEMADSANVFLKSLDAGQTAAVQFQFENELRKDWQFVPMERKGLGLKQMKPHQRGLAIALVQSALSHRGFATAMQIMAMEQVLFELENNSLKRDPGKYHVFLFGAPSTDGTWGWRVEGHHISVSVTVVDGKEVKIAPAFLGANPAQVREGSMEGVRVLGDIEDFGRALVKQLTVEQKAKAVIADKAPRDVILGPGKEAAALDPKGLPASELGKNQQAMLKQLIESYLTRFRAEVADEDRQQIEAAGFDKLHFAWAGQIQMGRPHYFRVQGPTFVLEYDNTQNGANHVHVVWRNLKDDFGADSLRKHYQTTRHETVESATDDE